MSIQPTFNGYVGTIHDALLLFQATINGLLMPVSRRPHDRERAGIIKSGAVFIFSEQGAGIKRWTDGISWSPSRILGNFLVYRQLEKPFGPGEKKRAAKKSKIEDASPTLPSPGVKSQYPAPGGSTPGQAPNSNRYNPYGGAQGGAQAGGYGEYYHGHEGGSGAATGPSPSSERSLVGSLVDSYGFKENGLIKKTISIVVSGIHHHMVSYYKPDDVLQGKFMTPSETEGIRELPITEELIKRQNFRIPPDSLNTTPGQTVSHSSYQGQTHQPHNAMYQGGAQGGAQGGSQGGAPAAQTAGSTPGAQASGAAPQSMPYYGQGAYYNQQFQPQMPPPIGRPQGYPSHPQGSQPPGQYPQSYPADYDPAAQGDGRSYVSGYRPFTTALPGISGNKTPTGTPGSASATPGEAPSHHSYYYNHGAPHPEGANGSAAASSASHPSGQGASHSPSLPPLGGEYSSTAPSNYSAMDPRKLPEGGSASSGNTPASGTPTQAPAPHGPLAAGARSYGANSYNNPSW